MKVSQPLKIRRLTIEGCACSAKLSRQCIREHAKYQQSTRVEYPVGAQKRKRTIRLFEPHDRK